METRILTNPQPSQIKDMREGVKLSQIKSAQMLHTTLRTWQRWEHGKTPMPYAYWELFAIKCQMLRDGLMTQRAVLNSDDR